MYSGGKSPIIIANLKANVVSQVYWDILIAGRVGVLPQGNLICCSGSYKGSINFLRSKIYINVRL